MFRLQRLTMEERFLAKIDKDGENGCWNWTAGKHGRGYGHFYTGKHKSGKHMDFAHRASYKMYKGDIPEGLEVMHMCNNTSCVNPDHLELGTHSENIRNAYRDGLFKMPKTKLTREQVLAIRADSRQQKEIALEYGIDNSVVSRIKNNKSWTHV